MNTQSEDQQKQQARKQKEIERFVKRNNNKVVHDVHLVDGKPQLICSICNGKSFSFVTGFFWFIFVITTFYRICNTCGKKSRHGGAIN
jgi:hypothetical protein